MNVYMRGFLSDIYLRPSCYACKCKNGASHSDLSIADFWGINIVAPDFDDDKGVGLVLINTQKGNDYFSRLDMDTLPSTLDVVHRCNGAFSRSAKAHPKRAKFFALLQQGKTVEQAVNVCLHIPLYKRCISKAKRGVKKIIKLVVGDSGVAKVKKMIGKAHGC